MQNVTFDGVTGKVSFDEYGDTTNKQLTALPGQERRMDTPWRPAPPAAADPRPHHRAPRRTVSTAPRGSAHQRPARRRIRHHYGGPAVNELPQQLANGLILGAMYGLIAIGYTMVYGIVQLINFAHGEIFMIGGFGALTVYALLLPDGTSPRGSPCPSCSSAASACRRRRHRRGTLRLPAPAHRTPPRPAHHRHRPVHRPPAGRLELVPRRQEGPPLPPVRRRPLRHLRRHHPDAATSSSSSPHPCA